MTYRQREFQYAQITASSFIQEWRCLERIPKDERPDEYSWALAHTNAQIDICRERYETYKEHYFSARTQLHELLVEIVETCEGDEMIYQQCVAIVELPIPAKIEPDIDTCGAHELEYWRQEIKERVLVTTKVALTDHINSLLSLIRER